MSHQPVLGRRGALLGLASAFTIGRASVALADAATEKRLVVVLLRGALDGLAAIVPYGDANLSRLRPGLVPPEPGRENGLLDMGGFYGLNPALPNLHKLYASGEMLAVHAVAGPYRTRSHFDAQDYLESGASERMTSGWLNRAVMALPPRHANPLAVGITVPLMLRGTAAVATYAPPQIQGVSPELYARIAALSNEDRLLGPALAEGLRDRGFLATAMAGETEPANRYALPAIVAATGKLLAAPGGPRIAVIEAGGWDTHANQATRLANPLRQLDDGVAALRTALGAAWANTAVLVMTEFGRTVRVNGSGGTDHGTAGAAFVAGGAVAGGRVLGTWPGLADAQLFENRDLAPTTDLRSLAMALLTGHLGLPPGAMASIFPGSAGLQAQAGLLRA